MIVRHQRALLTENAAIWREDKETTLADIVDARRRSAMMAKIGSRDTKPEMVVRRAVHAAGLRFRLHRRDLPGSPDLTFPRAKLAVFVHGCFWHRHEGCRNCTHPKTRSEFWQAKFASNVARDRRVLDELATLGWRVETIWECETEDPAGLARRVDDLRLACARTSP